MDMLCQQYEQVSGCSGCVTGGCNRQSSCDVAGCMKQCGAVTEQVDPGTRCQNAEKETWILKCNRRCQQVNCRLLDACLRGGN